MKTPHEDSKSGPVVAQLPLWLRISGVTILVGNAALAARLIWEQTVWTWEQGPQMVGFSLAHGFGAILFLFPVLLVIWTAIVIAVTVRDAIKKKQIDRTRWAALGLAALFFVVMELPDGFWQRLFIAKMAASPRAGDLLVYAAYRGDLGTVRGLISHGVSISAVDHADWRTAVHGAAVKNDTSTLRYLVSKGANINALDRSGDSPLELATSRNNRDAVEFLTEQGAKRIRGDEAQHHKAINDKVEEDIEQLDREEGIDRDIKKLKQDEKNQSEGAARNP